MWHHGQTNMYSSNPFCYTTSIVKKCQAADENPRGTPEFGCTQLY